MNLTEAKYAMIEIRDDKIDVVRSTSELFRPQAISDYEKKKAAEKAAIHEEIKRVTEMNEMLNSYI